MGGVLGAVGLTGAAGGIGSVLRPVLAELAERVVLMDRRPIRTAGANVTSMVVDLREPEAVVAACAES